MTMHTLIIKGDKAAAFAACDLHNMEVTSIVYRSTFNDTLVTVPATVPVSDLAKWLCSEPGEPPYPDGALLWYGPAKRDVPDVRFANTQEKRGKVIEAERFYSRAAGAHINLNKSIAGEGDQ
jgi:hypothetical protein